MNNLLMYLCRVNSERWTFWTGPVEWNYQCGCSSCFSIRNVHFVVVVLKLLQK